MIKSDFFYNMEHREEVQIVARRIAEMYLEKCPLTKSYKVTLTQVDTGTEFEFYFKLNNEELELLRQWPDAQEDYIYLYDFLDTSDIGRDLIAMFLESTDLFATDNIIDCDLDDTLQFVGFRMQMKDKDGNWRKPEHQVAPLTDEAYAKILAQNLIERGHLSINMLMARLPEVAQRIMDYIVSTYYDGVYEMTEPFILELDDIQIATEKILNKETDLLGLFNSDDADLRDFAIRHEVK